MASPASSDEGEIIENGAEDLKATSLPKKFEGSGVDRQDRHRGRYSRSRSPDYDGSPRHHHARLSRSPRGLKRGRDDRDTYNGGRHGQDPRRFRVHYEDSNREDYRRTRVSYEDLDRPPSRASSYSHENHDRDRSRDRDRHRDRERDRYANKQARNRSRSPHRPSRKDRDRERDRDRDNRYRRDAGRYGHTGDSSSRGINYDDRSERDSRNRDSVSTRVTVGKNSHSSQADTKPLKGLANDTDPPKATEPEQDFAEPVVIDEEAEIERRRRRRDELLAKSSSATPLLLHALHAADKSTVSSPSHTQQSTPLQVDVSTPRSGEDKRSQPKSFSNFADAGSPMQQDEPSPSGLDIVDGNDLMNHHGDAKNTDEDGPSAADYDPTVDMKEDGLREEMRFGNVGLHGQPSAQQQSEQEPPAPIENQQGKKRNGDGNDEEDDDFDMFAEDFDEEKYTAPQPKKASAAEEVAAPPTLAQPAGGILEGDDKDGYYKIRIGEIMNGRYQIQSTLGKGMFSGVARAVDITNKKLVAIKIMRNNDALRKGGFTEIAILQKLNDADPENRKHIVKFERHFDHKGHLCMAFENLSLNLREVLRKFGNNVGINLGATRAYAHQIFVGLAHMRKCNIVHADLKPDNILVNESRNMLKICDLGTGIDRSDAATAHNEITPYLVSRFYRAPEIILGMPYDYAIDMWSIGCTLYEMYTGKILFTGDSNNQMLRAIMEIRGKLTPKLYKRGQLSGMHFDDLGNFISVEQDKALGKTAVRTLAIVKPTRDLRTRLLAASAGMSDAETRDLNHFIDLLEHCLALNPEKRIKPLDALKHPFFTSRVGPSKR